MITCKALIAHPGLQYSPHLARELWYRNLLFRYWTGLAFSKDAAISRWLRRLPRIISDRFENRIVDIPPRLLRSKAGIEAAFRRSVVSDGEMGFFRRNLKFQSSIPETELAQASVIVGYDTSAWLLFRRAKELGKLCVLDQSIGHPIEKEKTYRRIRENFPAWSTSVPQKPDCLIDLEAEEHDLADLIVVPSTFTRDTLTNCGIPNNKIVVIPFGTDTSRFFPRAEYSIETERRSVFLFVGTLSARKGLPVLLSAWQHAACKSSELWLIGPGNLPEVEQRRLPQNVKILGAKSRPALAEIMRSVDVLVFPSFFEGLAQVQVEAVASGLPVIGTRESGGNEVVKEGVNGFVVPAGNVKVLADKLRILDNSQDLRQSMRLNSIGMRPLLTWGHYGDQWESALSGLTNGAFK